MAFREYAAPSQDTWMDQGNPAVTHGPDGTLTVAVLKRPLITFNITGPDANERIYRARLRIYLTAVAGGPSILYAVPVARNWVEADACWNDWSLGNAWTTAGADHDPDDKRNSFREISTWETPTTPTAASYNTFELKNTGGGGADYGFLALREWFSGDLNNYGWRLALNTGEWTMHSSEGANPPILWLDTFLLQGGQHGHVNA